MMPSERIETATVGVATMLKLLAVALTAGGVAGGLQWQISANADADRARQAEIAELRRDVKSGKESVAGIKTEIAAVRIILCTTDDPARLAACKQAAVLAQQD